jgi:hypothetical protein
MAQGKEERTKAEEQGRGIADEEDELALRSSYAARR